MTELETGVKVLIPATIGKVLDPGWAIVWTAGGNRIVEYGSDLRPVPDVEERTERLARAMCGADGVDPDEKAALGAPPAAAGGFLVGSAHFPAWRLYAKYARALIDGGLA